MTSEITFGAAGREWTYDPARKLFDLSPGAAAKLTIPTSEGSAGTSISLAPATTALVIVDMQNFFLDAQCMAHPNGLKAVEPTIAAIAACRAANVQIIWLNWGLTDADLRAMPASVHRGFLKDFVEPQRTPSGAIRPYTGLGSDLGESRGRCLVAGSWNADIYPPLKAHVAPADVHCAKNRMSGMWSIKQPLYQALVERGITTCLFTGVNTDQCVLGTFVDAYNKGFNCVLVNDCCGTTTKGAKEVTLTNVAGAYGFVIESEGLVGAVGKE